MAGGTSEILLYKDAPYKFAFYYYYHYYHYHYHYYYYYYYYHYYYLLPIKQCQSTEENAKYRLLLGLPTHS